MRVREALPGGMDVHLGSDPTHNPSSRWRGLQNYRRKRSPGGVPGWCDRWGCLGAVRGHPKAIDTLPDPEAKGIARRACVLGIACHVSILSATVSCLVFPPAIADRLRASTLFSATNHGHVARAVLLGVAVLLLLLLKLVLDMPRPRLVVFTLYSAVISLLVAATVVALDAVFAAVALVLGACGWWLTYALSALRIRGEFLSWVALGIAPCVLVSAALVVCFATILAAIPGHSMTQTAALAVLCALGFQLLGALELKLLFQTLPPQEASLAVYYVNLDLLVGVITQPVLLVWVVLCAVRRFLRRLVLEPFWIFCDALLVLGSAL